MKFLSIPSSAASAERCWSNLGFIHCKRRNRLLGSRAIKLGYVYMNTQSMKCIQRSNRPKLGYLRPRKNTSRVVVSSAEVRTTASGGDSNQTVVKARLPSNPRDLKTMNSQRCHFRNIKGNLKTTAMSTSVLRLLLLS